MNSDFDRPQPESNYSQARQEEHDRSLLRREHPASAGFPALMARVRADMQALNGKVYEHCFRCSYSHPLDEKCGKR